MTEQSAFSITVEVEPEVYEVLQTLAALKGITVGQVLGGMVREDIERIKSRMNDPIGIFNVGEPDVSERDEEILRRQNGERFARYSG